MHIISNSTLQNLGFTDVSKVRVYGTGGRLISYGLTPDTPDDLPQIPSVQTDKGIVFFAVDQHSWAPSNLKAERPYAHTIHPYSDDNYYFISDIESETYISGVTPTLPTGGNVAVTEFTARLIHEKELEPAGESGSQVYGEDFRTTRSQTFNFKLTDRVSGTDATAYIRFAAKTSNGSSSLLFKANGTQLSASTSDRISSTSTSSYANVTETAKTIGVSGENLDLTIDYSQSGVLYKARLDYIETFYVRQLALNGGELYFYDTYNVGEVPTISGCSSSTQIWDVTDPIRPVPVEFMLRGEKASFTVTDSGYREFVAFNPESITRSVTADGSVANQDLHALATPDMVIITHPEYREGAQKIAEMHRSMDGFSVEVLDADLIYNEFSGGKVDPGAFRRLLKMWYDRGENGDGNAIRYCLLMGKPSNDHKILSTALKNAGFTPMPIYQNYDGLNDEASYSCDDFIGMVEDVSDAIFRIGQQKVLVSIGRLPVTTSAQSVQMAEKIEKYAREAELGIWRNKIMLIADDEDSGAHLKQSETAHDKMLEAGNGASFVYDRVYLDSYKRVLTNIGPTYPQATERMLRNYNDGVVFTSYIGHASETSWGHEHLWEWQSIKSMSNKNLTFMYAATCNFLFWDRVDFSGGEELMLNPDAGIIGMIAASRKVYVDRNGLMTAAVLPRIFEYDAEGKAKRFGDAYREGRNTQLLDNSLRFAFMGDPALKIPNPERRVVFRTINGVELGGEYLPEVSARSAAEVTGEVLTPEGALDTDFNGTVSLQLFDGERVITTYGQGSAGVEISYNDRDKRLSMTTTRVEGGKWSATLHIPPEISGIYTPAMIAGYAWDDKRNEANGITTDLYVYGYNSAEQDDTEGPVIEYMYVNTPNFENGGLVSENAVVLARLSDESGINISDTGIGHSMILTVDNEQVFSDLNSYFTTDPADGNAGVLVYPLSGLSGGKHLLTLTAWDNANNMTRRSININVGGSVDPVIYGITASTNDTSLDFHIDLDRPNTALNCRIGIFDLGGRRIWSMEKTLNSDINSRITTNWDLRDSGGTRVARGIYIYRVTVETPEGTYSSKSKKIAVSAAN